MRQRLAIAVALMRRRDLLVLDEPTNGLDPQGTREVRALIRQLAEDGTTVFTSTHLLAEVEQVCTHAGGDESRPPGPPVHRARAALRAPAAARRPDPRPGPGRGHADPARRHRAAPARDGAVDGDPGERPIEEYAAALVGERVRIHGFGLERPSLEEAFVALTGEGFDVAE